MTAPFYGVYETKDGKFISLGALEKQFYNLFVKLINLQDDPIIASGRSDPSNWPYLRSTFQQTFLSKTQLEWVIPLSLPFINNFLFILTLNKQRERYLRRRTRVCRRWLTAMILPSFTIQKRGK